MVRHSLCSRPKTCPSWTGIFFAVGALIACAIGLKAETTEFRNSLGMLFHPVSGTDVRFSVWETRVADWNAYLDSAGVKWDHRPRFPQDGTHPVVNVTLDEALAFCEWLTRTERASGLLNAAQSYRLPTDKEWDKAFGLEPIPDRGKPVTAGGETQFPWGHEWPPPRDSGNYNLGRIDGAVDDGFRFTAPTGKFNASPEGLFDLGGNVSEWTAERGPAGSQSTAVLRGGSWMHFRKELLDASCRVVASADTRTPGIGFRCVLDDFAESARPDDRNMADSQAQRARLLEKKQVSDEELRRAVPQRTARATDTPMANLFSAVPGEPFENSLNMKLLPLTLPRILLGEHEVRVADYRRFLLDSSDPASSDSRFGAGIDHPITGVSWTEAEAFCAWLTRRERSLGSIPQDAAYRLPRIAEWRAAVTTNSAAGAARVFAWGSAWPPPANFANVASSETKPVKSHPANSAGFHDLAGNAAEWCADVAGNGRVHCGGSWKSASRDELQIDAVQHAPVNTRSPEIGFRVVLEFRGENNSAPLPGF